MRKMTALNMYVYVFVCLGPEGSSYPVQGAAAYPTQSSQVPPAQPPPYNYGWSPVW